MKNLKMVLTTVLAVMFAGVIFAEIPGYINYQGRAYSPPGSNTPVPDSTGHTITVRIYNVETGGAALWSTDITGVQTRNGLFNIEIGPLPFLTLDFNKPYWMSIEFNYDGEMAPRHKLLSAPYSFRSRFANVLHTNRDEYGPVKLTGASSDGVILSVTNTAGTGISAATLDGFRVAAIAGYNYSPSSETAGVYGFNERGIGVFGQSSGTAATAVQGENMNGLGGYFKGVTGLAADSEEFGGTALVANGPGSGSGLALLADNGDSVFYGPVTISALGTPGSLSIWQNMGTDPAIYAHNREGVAIRASGGSGGWPFACAISGTAKGAIGVYGSGVTGVAGIVHEAGAIGVAAVNDNWDGLALRADGRSDFYGVVTVTAVNPMDGALNVINDAGTGQAINAKNGPGTSIIGKGYIGIRGEGDYIGVDAITEQPGGYGLHAVNPDATGISSGSAVNIEGKIKITKPTTGTADSPAETTTLAAGGNPFAEVANNLCEGNNYHVYITPLGPMENTVVGEPVNWWAEKYDGYFTIRMNTGTGELANAVDFDYLIINK